jgi:hypothetical protein
MTRHLVKHKYYVKSGQLEKWVTAYDETSAAVTALDEAKGGIEIDPYLFYVSKNYIEDIENVLPCPGLDLVRIQTDDILEILHFEMEDDNECCE